ncbi:Phosphotransferase enzyme family protein [Halovenus aranensis]|uniref:Phosphotransferase enzyme family protein n=1 Tax=Halovenus aranensis TaxID=890420 RepID=A0A1G8W8P5_9EURY|nr:phosphotransferase [Halovenus aranensis]SDJ73890.1 Phosphotransferase enzyme family protein [Halovenus aranensis]
MTGIAAVVPDESFEAAGETALEAVTTEQPTDFRRLGRGNRKLSALATYEQRDPVVVQLCEELTWLQTEATLLGHIRERTAVPVPPVLASGITDGVAYMVTAHVSGDDLHVEFAGFDSEGKRRLARTFGAHLGSLHEQFRFEEYGALVVDGDSLRAWHEDWGDWLVEYGTSAVERLPGPFDPLREDLLALFETATTAQAPPARLYPWDFRPGNALVEDGQVAAILDWEAPMAAAPALAVAKAEYLVADWYVEDGRPLRRAFREGYEQVRKYPTVDAVHRAAAIADSAVDSTGTVTNPKYPELDAEAAVEFHREALTAVLGQSYS